MKSFFLTGILALSLGPTTLLAQSAGERIELAVDRAASVGIPIDLLRSKVDEGLAKGVPMDRIAAAVETRASLLMRARNTFVSHGVQVSPADLTAAADAFGAGISDSVLRTINRSAPADRRAVAITALTELVTMSVPVDQALDRVLEGLARGGSEVSGLRGPPPGRGERPSGAASSAASGITPPRGAPVRAPSGVPASGREGGPPNPEDRSFAPPIASPPQNGG